MTPIEQALNAIKKGDKVNARAILVNLVKVEPQNIDAWLLLSKVLDDPEQISYCKERAQTINKERFKTTEVTPLQMTTSEQPMKKCPYCAEMVLAEAEVCRYCGHNINPKIVKAEKTKEIGLLLQEIGCSITWLVILVPILICIILFVFSLFKN